MMYNFPAMLVPTPKGRKPGQGASGGATRRTTSNKNHPSRRTWFNYADDDLNSLIESLEPSMFPKAILKTAPRVKKFAILWYALEQSPRDKLYHVDDKLENIKEAMRAYRGKGKRLDEKTIDQVWDICIEV
eukprot:1550242-Karenia_brevis.AAC.1